MTEKTTKPKKIQGWAIIDYNGNIVAFNSKELMETFRKVLDKENLYNFKKKLCKIIISLP